MSERGKELCRRLEEPGIPHRQGEENRVSRYPLRTVSLNSDLTSSSLTCMTLSVEVPPVFDFFATIFYTLGTSFAIVRKYDALSDAKPNKTGLIAYLYYPSYSIGGMAVDNSSDSFRINE